MSGRSPLETVLRSATQEVVIGHDRRFCLIGERINPTGRRIFQEQLRAGDLSAIERDVKAQVEGGADVLDINMGVPLTDEAELLAKAITHGAGAHRQADLHRLLGRRGARGRAVGLPGPRAGQLDHRRGRPDGSRSCRWSRSTTPRSSRCPTTTTRSRWRSEKRLDLTRKIIEVATKEYGIAAADIVIDPLAMPIGADQEIVNTTLETMRRIRDEFGVNMTCGASNVSFGMPGRHTLGAAFLPMAMTAGLTSAIMDTRTPQIVEAVKAADLLLGHDEWGGAWIAAHRAQAGRRRPRPRDRRARLLDRRRRPRRA